jgi:hypothetical protein
VEAATLNGSDVEVANGNGSDVELEGGEEGLYPKDDDEKTATDKGLIPLFHFHTTVSRNINNFLIFETLLPSPLPPITFTQRTKYYLFFVSQTKDPIVLMLSDLKQNPNCYSVKARYPHKFGYRIANLY